jgi:hypothetical protein
MIKLKRMGWIMHVASMGERRNTYKYLVGNLHERGYYRDLVVGEDKQDGRMANRLMWFMIGKGVFQVPQNSENFFLGLATSCFSRRTPWS